MRIRTYKPSQCHSTPRKPTTAAAGFSGTTRDAGEAGGEYPLTPLKILQLLKTCDRRTVSVVVPDARAQSLRLRHSISIYLHLTKGGEIQEGQTLCRTPLCSLLTFKPRQHPYKIRAAVGVHDFGNRGLLVREMLNLLHHICAIVEEMHNHLHLPPGPPRMPVQCIRRRIPRSKQENEH